jgi:hypothetical protein
MARNVVKDYLDYDRQNLMNYISLITNKKLNSDICNMIIDTYINIRYFNAYTSIKKNPIDNIEYYVLDNFKKNFATKDVRKNSLLILDALIILRYVILYEKYGDKEEAKKSLELYEEKVRDKYNNTEILVSGIIKDVKTNYQKKQRFISELASSDFSIDKKNTNIANVFDVILDNSINIPDLFSDIAVNRVYNTGVINEDKMLVYYTLLSREILLDMINYEYGKKYLIAFPESIIERNAKLDNLLKIFNIDYLKERMIMKISYHDYLTNKDNYDSLIHDGYSFAVIIDGDVKEDMVLFNIFSYIIVDNDEDEKVFNEYRNVIKI